jgi:hypothetical protein
MTLDRVWDFSVIRQLFGRQTNFRQLLSGSDKAYEEKI